MNPKPRISHRRSSLRALALVGALTLAGCGALDNTRKTANMTPPSDRVRAALATSRPYCFGRFLVDLPEGAQVAWGRMLKIDIRPGRATDLQNEVKKAEDHYKSEERYPLTANLKLYIGTRESGARPGMRHVLSYKSFADDQSVRTNTYFPLGDALVTIELTSTLKAVELAISMQEDIARRLRLRDDHEIPTEPGECIEHAILVDPPGPWEVGQQNFVEVGFQLKEPGDVNLSIGLQAANPDEVLDPGLEKRLASREAEDRNAFRPFTIFRRAKRPLPAWPDGFEFLTLTPAMKGDAPHHDFWFIDRGVPKQRLRPYVDMRMHTGVANNRAGGTRPKLSDDEAIALWDAVTATIRVRPTQPWPAPKTSAVPLGTRSVTGRDCPQTGLWECVDRDADGGHERRWLEAGQRMPHATLPVEPTLIQRLRGERPTATRATEWRLVGLDAPGDAATSRPLTPEGDSPPGD